MVGGDSDSFAFGLGHVGWKFFSDFTIDRIGPIKMLVRIERIVRDSGAKVNSSMWEFDKGTTDSLDSFKVAFARCGMKLTHSHNSTVDIETADGYSPL